MVVLDGRTLNPGDNPWTPLEALGALTVYPRTPAREIRKRSLKADILLTNKTPLTARTIAALPHLKFIAVMATGYDVVDLQAASKRNIPVSNVPSYATNSVAQFVLALVLELCHRVSLHDLAVKNGEWIKKKEFCFWKTPQIELAGLKMGIVGFGRIGRRVAELAHALGMEVLAYAPRIRETPPYKPFAWKSLTEVFSEADVISLHCPLTDDTRSSIDKDLIGLMKTEAFLINTSRGPIINEADLAAALNARAIAGAAVDVVAEEPIQPDNPLLAARNCIITPHMAWASLSSRKRLLSAVADNVKNFLAGRPTNVVNPIML